MPFGFVQSPFTPYSGYPRSPPPPPPPPTAYFDPSRFPNLGYLLRVEEGFLLRVKYAKNAQTLDRTFIVPILRADSPLVCPVRTLETLLSKHAHCPLKSPLFCWPAPDGPSLADCCAPLTAPAARLWLGFALLQAQLRPDALSFHSFRRGGATLAALRGTSKPVLQALGNWKSDAVLAYYPPPPLASLFAHGD